MKLIISHSSALCSDRHHVHMNSTTWVTLTQYVKYLGREGICKVDQDEDGTFLPFV
jgi:DNA/RNA-binding protein KIN17